MIYLTPAQVVRKGSQTTDYLLKCRVQPASVTIDSLRKTPAEAANIVTQTQL